MTPRILTLLVLFTSYLPAADPQLLGLAMPDAVTFAGINVDQAKSSPFGQFLLSQIPTADQDFQKFVTATGFDPTRDVREVLVAAGAGSGASGAHARGLIMVRGMFDTAKIQGLTSASGKGTVETYNGVTILHNPNKSECMAFFDPTLVVLGQTDHVKAAIDRKSAASVVDPALLNKVNQMSSNQDIWFVTNAPNSYSPPRGGNVPLPPGGEWAQKVQQASGGIKFGSNIQMKVEAVTQTAEDATGMVNGLKFLLGMLAMNQNNPGQHQEALALLQNLSLTSQGNTVQMSLTIPEDQLEQVIRDSKSAHAKTSPAKDSPASLEPRIIQ